MLGIQGDGCATQQGQFFRVRTPELGISLSLELYHWVSFCQENLKMNHKYHFLSKLTLIGLGFFDIFRFGRRHPCPPPPLSSLFVNLSQRNFVQGLRIKALAHVWKNCIKLLTSLGNDVITVRKLPEKTVKRVLKELILKSLLLLHLIFDPTETLQKDLLFMFF